MSSADLDAAIAAALAPGADRQELRDVLQRARDVLASVRELATSTAKAYANEECSDVPEVCDDFLQLLGTAPVGLKTLRAGDHVRHHPSDEEWVVAYQDGEYVSWCGWPEGEARAADCELIWAATDAEHETTLRRLATGNDKRARRAREALVALEVQL